MELTVQQESFSAGEISPLAHGRYTSEGYASGCKELTNMLPDSRGPAISREGTKFVASHIGNKGRIYSHTVAKDFFYNIIFLDLLIKITSIAGHDPAINYALNSHFNFLATNWTGAVSDSSQTVDFIAYGTILSVTSSPNKWARIAQQVTVPAAGVYNVLAHSQGGSIYRVDVGTSAGDNTYGTATSAATEATITVTVPGTTFWITFTKDSNDSYDPVTVSYFGVTGDPVAPAEFVTPWGEDELADIHVIPVPSASAAYILHPLYAPRKLVYSITTDTFTFSTPAFTNPPSTWVGSNWPSAGTYFQGRLWLGATPNEPQSMWGSKSGLSEDFTPGTGLDDEAIAIVMAAYGRIEWIAATKNLLVGTESAEHIITSQGGVITPADHQVDQQSAYGSASIQAQQVGDQIFYISPDRTKLRAMQFEWANNNWLSTDLTYFSEHITRAKVKAVAWLQNPNNLFITILDDGTFAVLSYDRSNNIYGWSQHSVGGEVLDIDVASVNGVSILTMLVKRFDGKLYHESMIINETHYMDSWKEQYFITPTTAISGLDHLEGKVVQVMVDGATHPDKTVTAGAITLDRAGSTVVVGIQFIARIKLLPVEKGSQSGTSAPYMKNYHSLDVHLLDSAHPLVNGDRAPARSPSTPMGTPEPLITGKSYISLLGWKNETDIVIEQDLPLALTVVGVSGKLIQEKL